MYCMTRDFGKSFGHWDFRALGFNDGSDENPTFNGVKVLNGVDIG